MSPQISTGPIYIGIPEHKDMNVQSHLALVLRLYPVLLKIFCLFLRIYSLPSAERSGLTVFQLQ